MRAVFRESETVSMNYYNYQRMEKVANEQVVEVKELMLLSLSDYYAINSCYFY